MAKIKGLEKVIANLNKEVLGVKKRSKKGLIKLGLEIKRRSQLKTPIEFGNLKASHYVAWKGSSTAPPAWKADTESPDKMVRLQREHNSVVNNAASNLKETQVRVGVSAFYAGIQHENLEFQHTVGEAKFMERAIREITPNAAKIVAEDAKF